MNQKRVKYLLQESDMVTSWYNIAGDLPFELAPPLHPQTLEPLTPDDLSNLFPAALIEQEMSASRSIDIPGQVLDIYRQWRPTPLFRARRLEQVLGTPARIYYKYEGTSPVGSHKPNTAIPQAYYNKQEGTRRLTTETGAGQWGSALSMACAFLDLECVVYMVKVSYHQKPYRRLLMQAYGAEVFASPSPNTETGRATLARFPDTPGTLGMAISEAVEDAVSHPGTKYALGSVLNHVLTHQTVIGLEAEKQMAMAGDKPDYVVACCGGGSNFGGLAFPFLRTTLQSASGQEGVPAEAGLAGRKPAEGDPQVIAVEPAACPSLTRGRYAYDYGDSAGSTPVLKMHTLGHDFVPPGIHAGGLRYHGVSPIISALYMNGLIQARSVKQLDVFEAALLFARSEGILPAPESAHAIRVAVDLAQECKRTGESKSILFGLSGHGHFDLASYEAYGAGKLQDYAYTHEELETGLKGLPDVRF